MYTGKKSQISDLAIYICTCSSIEQLNSDLILLTGECEAKNNLEAVKKWVSEQTDLIGIDMKNVRDTMLLRFRDFVEECFEEAMDKVYGGIH